MIRNIVICVIVWICWFGKPIELKSQDLAGSFQLAQKAFDEGDYEQSIALLQRVIYFDSLAHYNSKAYRMLADANYQTKNWQQASYYYDLAYYAESDEKLLNELIFRKTSSLLLMKDFGEALRELYHVYPQNEEEQKAFYFYQASAIFALGDYDQSLQLFNKLLSNAEDSVLLKKYIDQIKKAEQKRAKRARIYSYLLPGWGQLYAHDYRAAANSFLLNGFFAALYMVVAVNFSFIDAVMSVGPWFYRYYSGGVLNAEQALERYKSKVKSKNYDLILRLIEV